MTESRQAFHALLDALHEIDARYLSPEWKIDRPEDVADGHRAIMHMLLLTVDLLFEGDPDRPVFRPYAGPNRKVLGDNPDALYYGASVRPGQTYRIRGNRAGAVFTSIGQEIGTIDGHYSKGVVNVVDDTQLKVDRKGNYELIIGPEQRPGNWFPLHPEAYSVVTRHYFEESHSIAADPSKVIPLVIEPLDAPAAAAVPNDASIAAGIRRVAHWLRGATLEQPPSMQPGKVPSWVSTVPNQFNPPGQPAGDIGLANMAAAYAFAPYVLDPDQALLIEGRFPRCRFASVVLYDRYLQSYDYVSARISLNRKQTKLERDGSFRMVVAHGEPGIPNWLNTQGRTSGLIQVRYLLPEEPIAPLKACVVPMRQLTGA